MEKNFGETEKLYESLIQNTPFIDNLILAFASNENYAIDGDRLKIDFLLCGCRQQKVRRFYDWLLHEYPKVKLKNSFEQEQQLWKNFNNSGNASAMETLQLILAKDNEEQVQESELNDEFQTDDMPEYSHEADTGTRTSRQRFSSIPNANAGFISTIRTNEECEKFDFTIACRAARVGDVAKLVNQLKACKKGDLRPVTEKDWSSKTLLHNIVDRGLKHPNQIGCIDVLIEFAEKCRMKNVLLDAKDLLNGETALHLAIKTESVVLCQKLLSVGADSLIKNRNGTSCLEMLYDKLPKVVVFLLDKSVATNGDTTGDLFDLSLDFGTVTGYVDTINIVEGQDVEEDSFSEGKRPHAKNDSTKSSKLRAEENNILLNILPQSAGHSDSESEEEAKYPIVAKSLHSNLKNKTPNKEARMLGEMGLLANMIYTNPESCAIVLSHPVVKTFLDMKWKKMKNIFRLATFLQISYFVLFMYVVYDIYLLKCPHTKKEPCQWSTLDVTVVSLLLASNLIFLLKEVFEAKRISGIQNFRTYCKGIENWLQLTFGLLVFAITIPVYHQNHFQKLQYGIASCGILLASILIVMVIGNSNQSFIIHSAYVHVYGVIVKRFLTVLMTFFVVLVAFALAFSVVFGKSILSFTTFTGGFGKMFMMLAGEFNFDEMFYKSDDKEKSDDDPLMTLAKLLYIGFAAFVTIVLIDVFLGYTISDIQDLKKRAEEVWRSVQVEQLFVMEGFFNCCKILLQNCFSSDNKLVNLIDTRIVIPQRKIMTVNMMQFELTSFGVLLPFKHLQPQMRNEFREILNSE